ncbi:MAG: zinc-ribbon domain-containing protein [Deltaproteobacteria bacterium]|nr:zinc-ribbon domain-containing protein [Deltaproteobacteria bacterium]
MIEIQCTSCNTRYRIDERVLPEETPTFKCSRCGHVFKAEPLPARPRKPAAPRVVEKPQAPPTPEAEQPSPPPPVQSKPVAEGASGPQTGEPPSAASSTEAPEQNPLDRTFTRERSGELESGENLTFDFANEPNPGEQGTSEDPGVEDRPSEDHWEVGEAPEDPRAAADPVPREIPAGPKASERPAEKPFFTAPPRGEAPSPGDFRSREFTIPDAGLEEPPSRRARHKDLISDEVANLAAHRPTHSSGWFLGLFMVVAVLFGVVSLAIHIQPAPVARILSQIPQVGTNFERPMVPAMLVALHDVHADYQQIKGGQTALLISGTAENVGGSPLHGVLLAVDLLDAAGKQLASSAAFCGNGLTAAMVGEMTPREIEFLQRLDPQKNFTVDPSKTAPFLLVFIDPPPKITKLRIEVAKAVAAPNAPAPRS